MIRLLLSATTDLDADAHVRWLIAHADARPGDVVTREWPLIARAALRLRRLPRGDDLITVGEAALLAATFGRRSPRFHIVVGAPTTAELAALRRSPRVRAIVSTIAAHRALRRAGIDADRVDRLVPEQPEATADRDAARRRLGLDGFTVFLPGTVRAGSGHRLAIWAAALLAYRDPTWRFLVSRRGDVARARRFITAMMPPDRNAIRFVDEAEEADAIAAADVALFAGEGVPERSMIDACGRAGAAIVTSRHLAEQEQIEEATTFDAFKARLVARAVLLAWDRRDEQRVWTPPTGRSWSDVLPELSRV